MPDCFLLFDEKMKEHLSSKIFPLFEKTVLSRSLSLENIPDFPLESRVYAYISDQQAPAVISQISIAI